MLILCNRDTRLKSIGMFVFFIFFIAGCSMKMFSSGWELTQKAQTAFAKKNYSEALLLASEAVKADYDLDDPKLLLKDNHDHAVKSLNRTLRKLNSRTVKGAEKKYYILSRLAKYYSNLKSVKLPLTDKDGKWTWQPKILDYNSKSEKARINAYNVLLRYAKRDVKRERFKSAETLFRKVIDLYIPDGSPEKQQVTDTMKGMLSSAYYRRAIRYSKRGGVKNLEIAVTDFENSLKWDVRNERAKDQLERTKRRLAELYYKKGRRFERRDRTRAANAYAMAIKWVPGYKDAKQRIVSLFISKELLELEQNIAETQRQIAALGNEPKKLAADVAKAMDAMNKMTYLSDKLRQSDEKMKNISSTLRAFNMIPMVNNATRVVGGVINNSRNKIHPAVVKFDRFEKPVITPTKQKISQVQTITNQVIVNISEISATIGVVKSTMSEINRCIENQNDPHKLIDLGKKAGEINIHVVKLNRALKITNMVIGSIVPAVKKVSDIQPVVSKAARAAGKVAKPLNQVGKATHEIDKVLKKKISLKIPIIRKKISISIHKILTKSVPKAARKILNKFSKLAMKALNPVLKKLKIRIPEVPGLNRIKREIGNIKGSYRQLKRKASDLKKSVTDLEGVNRALNQKLNEAKNIACSNI